MSNMYNLTKLRKSTKIKLVFMSLAIALPLIIAAVLTPISSHYFKDDVNIPIKVLDYVIIGLGEAFIITKIVFYGRLLKSDNFAEAVLIKRNDERVTFIRQKYSSFALKMGAFILLIAIVVTGFINTLVFSVLCITLIVMLIVVGVSMLYYNKKY